MQPDIRSLGTARFALGVRWSAFKNNFKLELESETHWLARLMWACEDHQRLAG